jgi:hypothetical protein
MVIEVSDRLSAEPSPQLTKRDLSGLHSLALKHFAEERLPDALRFAAIIGLNAAAVLAYSGNPDVPEKRTSPSFLKQPDASASVAEAPRPTAFYLVPLISLPRLGHEVSPTVGF